MAKFFAVNPVRSIKRTIILSGLAIISIGAIASNVVVKVDRQDYLSDAELETQLAEARRSVSEAGNNVTNMDAEYVSETEFMQRYTRWNQLRREHEKRKASRGH